MKLVPVLIIASIPLVSMLILHIKYKDNSKIFRLMIVISLFWLIGWYLGLEPSFLRGTNWEIYLTIAIIPIALFWSYYWINSAKD